MLVGCLPWHEQQGNYKLPFSAEGREAPNHAYCVDVAEAALRNVPANLARIPTIGDSRLDCEYRDDQQKLS